MILITVDRNSTPGLGGDDPRYRIGPTGLPV